VKRFCVSCFGFRVQGKEYTMQEYGVRVVNLAYVLFTIFHQEVCFTYLQAFRSGSNVAWETQQGGGTRCNRLENLGFRVQG